MIKNHNYRLLLDMDGIIANFHKEITKAYGIVMPAVGPVPWNVEEAFGIPKPWWARCDYDFWTGLEKTDEADQIVALILEYFDTENICVLTGYTSDIQCNPKRIGESLAGKLAWLDEHFQGVFKHFSMASTKHFNANARSILIDDNDHQVERFRSAGGYSILVPRIWNARYDFPSVGIINLLRTEIAMFTQGY